MRRRVPHGIWVTALLLTGVLTVTACGKTVRRLLYNYGTPPVPGVPDGMQYLPAGNYVMTA